MTGVVWICSTYNTKGKKYCPTAKQIPENTLISACCDVLKISDELTVEIKEHLKKSSRMVRRAIMANTIDKLPVFFNSPQEVAEYVTMSLEQCDDEAEKYASKQLIMEMMF